MKAVALLFLFGLGAVLSASIYDEEWEKFKDTFGKQYSDETEETLRKSIFIRNKMHIDEHNSGLGGLRHHSLEMNQFGDMTNEEFVAMMNGYGKSGKNPKNGSTFLVPLNIGDLPESVDWRDKGFVTPIKDQGQCGSCWAFSATGSLEGQNFRKTGKLVSLSEQNLVDCSGDFGNFGCGGGLMDYAFEYIEANKGIDTEESYPYKAEDLKCRFKKKNIGATDTGYVDISSGDEDALKAAVATVGPISVAIDASQMSFQFYSDGVYVEENCSSEFLDHGVLAVGYGTDKESGMDYWLVKNSWGTVWGDNGYIKMARNRNNMCGIATASSYPQV